MFNTSAPSGLNIKHPVYQNPTPSNINGLIHPFPKRILRPGTWLNHVQSRHPKYIKHTLSMTGGVDPHTFFPMVSGRCLRLGGRDRTFLIHELEVMRTENHVNGA